MEAFRLYTQVKNTKERENIKLELDNLILTMNSKRTNFDLPITHQIHLTSQWLLGFTEGDGCFSYNKYLGLLVFALGQKGNLPLMNAIRNYINNLVKNGEYLNDAVYVYYSQNISSLRVEREYFINQVLIPFFSSRPFQTKKHQDFVD